MGKVNITRYRLENCEKDNTEKDIKESLYRESKIKKKNEEKERYIREINPSIEELEKMEIEKPSEIVVIHNGDGVLIGKVSLWHRRPDYEGKKTSYIGNISIKAMAETEKEIFEEIFNTLRKEGVKLLIGPLNGTTWNSYRYVVERGERPSFLLEPRNENNDVTLLENVGFSPFSYYFSSIMGNMEKYSLIREKREKAEKILERKLNRKKGEVSTPCPENRKIEMEDMETSFEIRTAEGKNLEELLVEVYNLTRESFKNNFLYTDMERENFLKMYMGYKDKLVRRYFKLLYVGNKLVGYLFGIPDYLELTYKPSVETVILKTIGVAPEYFNRGIGAILIDEFVKDAKNDGYKNVIFALMHEKNVSKNIGLQLGKSFRKYALFKREL